MLATIDKYISQLLFEHECVVVPDFGAFLTRYYPAEINSATYMMRPPSRRVSFNKRIHENDGVLAKYISLKEDITYSQALESISISVRGWKRILKSGSKVNLPGIGRLYMDNESRIHFNPAIDINYHKESFGLSIFRSPAVYREIQISKTIQKAIEKQLPARNETEKHRRRTPALRWAAVLAPFVGLGILGGIYFSNENTGLGNWAGLNPFLYSSPKSEETNDRPEDNTTQREETKSVTPEIYENNPATPVKAHTSLTVPEEKGSPAEEETAPAAATETSAGFHIVVGSFKEETNAHNYIAELRARGFDAYIAKGDTSYKRIAVGNFSTRDAATEYLIKVKQEINPGSWVYMN